MTLITLITVNAVIGATVVYGLVSFLAFGIRSDRIAHGARVRALPQPEADRLAA